MPLVQTLTLFPTDCIMKNKNILLRIYVLENYGIEAFSNGFLKYPKSRVNPVLEKLTLEGCFLENDKTLSSEGERELTFLKDLQNNFDNKNLK